MKRWSFLFTLVALVGLIAAVAAVALADDGPDARLTSATVAPTVDDEGSDDPDREVVVFHTPALDRALERLVDDSVLSEQQADAVRDAYREELGDERLGFGFRGPWPGFIPFDELTPEEREELEGAIDELHDFLGDLDAPFFSGRGFLHDALEDGALSEAELDELLGELRDHLGDVDLDPLLDEWQDAFEQFGDDGFGPFEFDGRFHLRRPFDLSASAS